MTPAKFVLAIVSLGGSNATKEMLLGQQQASDQWAFYQAKVIREHQYRAQALRLEAELLERGATMRSDGQARARNPSFQSAQTIPPAAAASC